MTPDGSLRVPIRRLSEDEIARIAAGEVVERPSSVVKELVENAVDAGASEVRIVLAGGGLERIRVEDDGQGIPEAELSVAVERYATSKLPTGSALDGVPTLGFRGEALAAIGAVSQMRIVSRTPGSTVGHGISVVAGAVVGKFVEGRAPGTTVEVQELFFNTPARRKFLKSAAAEQVEVVAAVEHLYLARPQVGLAVANESGELLRLPPAAGLGEAAARVFGPEFRAAAFEVRGDDGPASLAAHLGRPSVTRSTASSLVVSVNGRTIVSRGLTQAVRAAYIDFVPKGRHPVGAVALEIPLDRVDVNVHPTKREVRIARERELAEWVRTSVRRSLRESPQVGELPPPPTGRASVRHLPAPATELPPLGEGSARGIQRTLGPPLEAEAIASSVRYPELRLIGPAFRLYWLAEADDALVLIDQHAASERLTYDALRRSGRLARQELVAPVRVELTPRQAGLLEERRDDIERSGFVVEEFGGSAFRVLAVPSYRGHRVAADGVAALLDELGDGGRPTVPDGLVERIDASLACHASVRAGDPLEATDLRRILSELFELPDASFACPHGRPILVRVPRGRLDRWFLRSPPP